MKTKHIIIFFILLYLPVNIYTTTFTEINTNSLKPAARGSITLGDLDNDGDLDLIITGQYTSIPMEYVGKVYQNDGSGGFT